MVRSFVDFIRQVMGTLCTVLGGCQSHHVGLLGYVINEKLGVTMKQEPLLNSHLDAQRSIEKAHAWFEKQIQDRK